jgi:hypothetical protein
VLWGQSLGRVDQGQHLDFSVSALGALEGFQLGGFEYALNYHCVGFFFFNLCIIPFVI